MDSKFKKNILIGIVAITLLSVFIAPSSMGADDTVTITVRIKQVGIDVNQSTWAVGWVDLSSTSTTPDFFGGGGFNWSSAQNTGNFAENFYANSSDTTNWTLADTAASEVFGLKIGTNDSGAIPWSFTSFDNASWNVTIGSSIGAGEFINFGLQFLAPTATDATTEQSITLTLTGVLA